MGDIGTGMVEGLVVLLVGVVLIALLLGAGLTLGGMWIYKNLDIEMNWGKKPERTQSHVTL